MSDPTSPEDPLRELRSTTDEATRAYGPRRQLSRLRAILAQRFAEEEGRDGLFDVLLAMASRNQGRVQLFKKAHAAILASLDAIVARLDDKDYDHRPEMADLATQVEKNRSAESAVFQDAMNDDIGGEG